MDPVDLAKLLKALQDKAPEIYRHIIGIVRAVLCCFVFIFFLGCSFDEYHFYTEQNAKKCREKNGVVIGSTTGAICIDKNVLIKP